MSILDEFWYGKIEPTEYDTSCTEYKKLQERGNAQSLHDRRAERPV